MIATATASPTSLLGSILAGMPGGVELWIVLFIVLILFGRRLPGVARSLGQGISSFKKGLNEPVEADDGETNEEQPKAVSTTTASTTTVSTGTDSASKSEPSAD